MLTRKVEDYLEAIYTLVERKGFARNKEIAEKLGIRSPSVTEMVKKLNKEGLVTYEKYSGITLTGDGKKIAKIVKERHETLIKLLRIVQIPEEIAEKDACTIEHHLNSKTIDQLKKFVDFVEKAGTYPRLTEDFDVYCRGKNF